MVNITPPPQGIDPKVYNYLYQMAELLNVVLPQQGGQPAAAEKQMRTIQQAAQQSNQSGSMTGWDGETYLALKSLILKTADVVSETKITTKFGELEDRIGATEEVLAETENKYVAVSEFGTYLEEINSSITLDSAALTQYYSFVSSLETDVGKLAEDLGYETENREAAFKAFENWKTETQGYIRSGIVHYENGLPVIGIAVGQNLSAARSADYTDETGITHTVPVIEEKGFRAIYGAKELSFWQDNEKVAYMSNNKLYITNVTALGKLTVGSWEIVDTNGLEFRWSGG